MAILRRQNLCENEFGQVYNCSSGWNSWGRWVALALIIVFFILLFFTCSCITSRRRRALGRQPYWGTGWAAHGYYPNNQYNQPQRETINYYYDNNASAPPYYSRNDQQTGIEMPARPDNAYAPQPPKY